MTYKPTELGQTDLVYWVYDQRVQQVYACKTASFYG